MEDEAEYNPSESNNNEENSENQQNAQNEENNLNEQENAQNDEQNAMDEYSQSPEDQMPQESVEEVVFVEDSAEGQQPMAAAVHVSHLAGSLWCSPGWQRPPW